MKLGDEVCDREFRQVDIFVLRFETVVEIDGPLACNVVRDLEVGNLTASEIRCDDVIGVDIPNTTVNNRRRGHSIEEVPTAHHAGDHQQRSGGQNSGARRPP
jgi:hypothetical protein